ncbi:hypothetical protein BV22DRAFT_1093023 [Leucogyrophana mollusca]|uniref:Uncharacterized protein n=1 Tax=Leucogyrophana mollusca TaxID=85980 RepID=A0ACB8BC49_9AGAM|nr:hypothetical protein BV22DRAFT_1093023 [Leucogyrophana mollusca]
MLRKSTGVIDHEIAVIHGQIDVLQRREDDFALVLQDMRRLLESVKAEKVALDAKITELESQKHPINWLPAELLIHIFIFSAADDPDASNQLSYNISPVVLSHVCHKWRQIVLSTSSLWSQISYRTDQWHREPLETFLQRSGSSLLDICFAPILETERNSFSPEVHTATQLVHQVAPHQSRWRSIAFGCNLPTSLDEIVDSLTQYPTSSLSHLQSLDLAILIQDPSFAGSSLLTNDLLDQQDPFIGNLVLSHMRLQQIPLMTIPGYLLSNVRTLELCYPPKKVSMHRPHHYTLRMSHCFRFLQYAPRLEELVLAETVPFFDVALRSQHGESNPIPVNAESVTDPLELATLRSLVWKFAYPRDIHRFLSLFTLPLLERWDLSIASPSVKRNDIIQFRGNYDPDTFTQAEPLNSVISLTALKELDLHCQSEDTLGLAMRRFMFPSLERLQISHIGTQPLQGERQLPSLPRLESIFRDPRLPHLTHLTLSHFDISQEHGKMMLGYTPSLVSLSIGSCTGVGIVLHSLAESCGSTSTVGKGVRVCPRLEELTLWGCADAAFKHLFAVVCVRAFPPDANIVDKTREARFSDVEAASAVLGRAIRPLKRSRRQGGEGTTPPAKPSTQFSSGVVSTLIPISEALRPARIAYVHVDDCPLITESEALSLEEFGVVVSVG